MSKNSHFRSTLLKVLIILLENLCLAQSNVTEPNSKGVIQPSDNNSPTDLPQPDLNPDLEQTKKAVETIHTSSRKDILVWRSELLETQKYFDKLKIQNQNEEKLTQTSDTVFQKWADKTEDRLSLLLGAMSSRLDKLDRETDST